MTITRNESALTGRSAGLPPELLFAVAGIAQYAGASVAVRLFDEVRPATVAFLRVVGGALAVGIYCGRSAFRRWNRGTLTLVGVFGAATALMNVFIYFAFERLDLGKAVAIEFSGPIVVAALATRTRRNALALVLAAAGVFSLSRIDFDAAGLGWVFAASTMWAAYILTGWRVAQLDRGLEGLAVGLLLGSVVILPMAAPGLPHALSSPSLVGRGLAVGLLSTAVAYGIDQVVLRRATARRFAVMQAMLPVMAALVGAVALRQYPHGWEYLGIALILVAVATQSRTS